MEWCASAPRIPPRSLWTGRIRMCRTWVVDPARGTRSSVPRARCRLLGTGSRAWCSRTVTPTMAEGAELYALRFHKPGEGESAGPFRAIATPGALGGQRLPGVGAGMLTGDSPGQRQRVIAPREGSLSEYLESLRRCVRSRWRCSARATGPTVGPGGEARRVHRAPAWTANDELLYALDAACAPTSCSTPLVGRPGRAALLRRPLAGSHLEKLAEEGG